MEAVELVEEFEREEELVGSRSAVADPSPNPAGGLFLPGELLGLALRFAALLAVQTAVAVWFLGRREPAEEGRGEGAGVRVQASEEEEAGEGSEVQEFEKAVSEIREMAREAREVEAKEAEEEAAAASDGVKGEVGRGISKLRKSRAKRVLNEEEPPPPPPSSSSSSRRKRGGPVKSKSRMLSVPKGFNRQDSGEKDANVVETGGIQQIAHENPVKQSEKLHESRLSRKVSSKLHTSTQRTSEGSESGHLALSVNNYPKQSESQSEKSFKEGNVIASTMSTHVNGRSMSGKDGEEESKVHKCEDSTFSPRNIPWWTKLPYVLAILLHRRSDHNGPKGLYSLKMDSPSEDDGSAYYTVVFQDQGDATNFCYLLESFFADLDDFVADVVPLEIHELEEGVRSNAIKVIVIKKGQVQLYAGQPLTEVETVLRTLAGKQEV